MEPDTAMPARKPPDPLDALKAAKDLAKAEHPAPADKTADALAALKAAKEWAKADRPALADKARDLEALRTSVVDAATVGFGIWITYLGALFYLIAAAPSHIVAAKSQVTLVIVLAVAVVIMVAMVVMKVKAVDDLRGRAARALSAAAQEVEPGTARAQP